MEEVGELGTFSDPWLLRRDLERGLEESPPSSRICPSPPLSSAAWGGGVERVPLRGLWACPDRDLVKLCLCCISHVTVMWSTVLSERNLPWGVRTLWSGG